MFIPDGHEKNTRLFTNFGRVIGQKIYIWYRHFRHAYTHTFFCKTMEFYQDSTLMDILAKPTEVQRGNSLQYGIIMF